MNVNTRRTVTVLIAAAVLIAVAPPSSAGDGLLIGRYSTPEMADVIAVAPAAVEPTPTPASAPAAVPAPVVPAPVVAHQTARVTPKVSTPTPATSDVAPQPTVTDDPAAGPYTYDPEQPNEGRPNGAGGWEPDPIATP